MRIKMLADYIDEYEADGLLINSIKSCNSFSAGQLLDDARSGRVEAGKPAAFVKSDLITRATSPPPTSRTRLESYFQMIEQKRASVRAA